ncbi:endonuclease I family protein [Vitiosangium sp. GDMCC 1.1324]|uniref:endonuclease I family protein n=1 Tax=Vitiosangium sp. (strain GDMCC 1.1324) TaxID=2138576 RepID=UPI000D373CA2|nr:endonuclease [Vitiosangium sp. GDMCC 1.1324]PTL76682.1 endonuclease I [Vitiosangium sp. GDMCC 1.1324]
MLVRSTTAARSPIIPAAAEAPRPSPRPATGGAQGPVDVFEPSGRDPRFEGLKDKALIQALHDAVAKHKDLGYSQARKVIFTALDNHDGKVACVYTGRELRTDKIPNSSDMNVEHTWPQSQGAVGAAKSDLHHLFPTDSKANSIRSSYPFGVVKNVQWSQGGAKFGTDAQGRKVFEPPDAHKGNVARALFYFSTVYGKPIPAQDEAVLKQWNVQDQVDAAERARNDAIEKYQGNRNPFVDDASLARDISDF